MPDMSLLLSHLLSPQFRPAWEVLALILASSLIGFFVARWMYRSRVAMRTDLLRFEQTRWRRRLSQSSTSITSVARDRDRSQRKLRRARADITRMSSAAKSV
jgi:hypothetical protein